MTPTALLSELERLDVRLEPKGERLKVDAPKGVLTRELREGIARYKAILLELLKDRRPVQCLTCGSMSFWWRATMTENGPRGDWLCAVCHPDPLEVTR